MISYDLARSAGVTTAACRCSMTCCSVVLVCTGWRSGVSQRC